MVRVVRFALLVLCVACLLPAEALAQGETTSAIVGQVRDTTNAVVPGAIVTITNPDTGLRRRAKTDDLGRFNFPQLKPGIYSVKVEAPGFEPRQNNNVVSALGQKQTLDFTLGVARSRETVEVSSEAPILNPENANTSVTLNAPALEDLANPGGDLTYPLQFAAGALINTAGSGNDFVGGTNGYGNVEFNGLPALSNGYIVDGLKTNDPLTNLNSGLSTNLVLGLNSISEVTVNTLSYSVDQGRYGASQVNYVTKSGTNQFHGNLYELWNGSLLNAADYFTNARLDLLVATRYSARLVLRGTSSQHSVSNGECPLGSEETHALPARHRSAGDRWHLRIGHESGLHDRLGGNVRVPQGLRS